MEYSKDELFLVSYSKKEDKQRFGGKNRLLTSIMNNKFLTLLITLGIIFSSINFILIYKFTQILKMV